MTLTKSIFAAVLVFTIPITRAYAAKTTDNSGTTIIRTFCNGLDNPTGVVGAPTFSWWIDSERKNCFQKAYSIELSTNPDFKTLVWKSGKVDSDNSVNVTYSGDALESATRYYWRVKIWDDQNKESALSKTSSFVTGLSVGDDWAGAKWIAMQEDKDVVVPFLHAPDVPSAIGDKTIGNYTLPVLHKEISVDRELKSAYAFVCGLGHFDFFINGAKVGNHFLDPGWTKYDKEALYVGFDITQMMGAGKNNIGVMLGNGMYNIPRERYFKITGSYGAPKLKCLISLEYQDGRRETIVSDETWSAYESPIRFSSIYGGEDFDASRAAYLNSQPSKVVVADGPQVLKPQMGTALTVKGRFPVQKVLTSADGKTVYDFGQNISGIIALKVKGRKGQTIRLTPGELLDDEGRVNQSASGDPYYYTYTIGSDTTEYWQPQFSYYGMRYAEVDTFDCGGTMPEIEPTLLHTSANNRETGRFRCSDPFFNRVYDLIDYAMSSNTASVLTDCPHREKLGWLEQAHLMQNSLMYRRDMRHIYRKVMSDMAASQTESGAIPTIAPEYVRFNSGFEDSPEWGSAFIQCPYKAWLYYGDDDLLKEYYPAMKRFMDYLGTRADGHIIAYGLGDWYDIGPNDPGYSQLTSYGVTGTAIYYQNALAMAQIAAELGEDGDCQHFTALAKEIKEAFNAKFYHPEKGYYDRNSQTANAMAIALDIVEPVNSQTVTTALVDDIKAKGLTAGDIGYWYVIKALEKTNNAELLYQLNKQYQTPGYGWQLAHGATCLTESWQAYGFVSNNHMMLGHLMEWLFSGLAGISIDSEKGSRHLIIAPHPVGDIAFAEASIETPYGPASCRWERDGADMRLTIDIPGNSYATVRLPEGDIKIGSGRHYIDYTL